MQIKKFVGFARQRARPGLPNVLYGSVRRKKIEKKFLIARAFAKRFGTRHHQPQIVSTDAIAAKLGAWGLCAQPATERRESAARARLETKASGSGA